MFKTAKKFAELHPKDDKKGKKQKEQKPKEQKVEQAKKEKPKKKEVEEEEEEEAFKPPPKKDPYADLPKRFVFGLTGGNRDFLRKWLPVVFSQLLGLIMPCSQAILLD